MHLQPSENLFFRGRFSDQTGTRKKVLETKVKIFQRLFISILIVDFFIYGYLKQKIEKKFKVFNRCKLRKELNFCHKILFSNLNISATQCCGP